LCPKGGRALMQNIFESAFRPPPKAPDAGHGGGFAILPQQTEDELVLSEIHSKLDRALNFLQHDLGYTLLDDVRPCTGGGVSLCKRPTAPAACPKGHRSIKMPKESPNVQDEVAREIIRFSPDTAKYAQYPDDIVLVWRFANILVENSPSAEKKVKHEILYKTVLQGVRLMHLCDYSYSDVVVTLAYASVYFQSTYKQIGSKMSNREAAHVCVLLIYLAHSFVLDETCPLRFWHKHIFRRYCTLKVLDAALFRLFQMRGFKLHITEDELKHSLCVLLCSNIGFDVLLSLGDNSTDGLSPHHMEQAAGAKPLRFC